MSRWMILVLLLAACGSDSAGSGPAASSAGGSGGMSAAGQTGPETHCKPHPNGAPCCPQDWRPTQEDCPEGARLRVGENRHNLLFECVNERGLVVAGAPYVSYNKAFGAVLAFRRPGDSFTTSCWPETGYQRYRLYDDEPSCFADCYDKEGRAANCEDIGHQPPSHCR